MSFNLGLLDLFTNNTQLSNINSQNFNSNREIFNPEQTFNNLLSYSSDDGNLNSVDDTLLNVNKNIIKDFENDDSSKLLLNSINFSDKSSVNVDFNINDISNNDDEDLNFNSDNDIKININYDNLSNKNTILNNVSIIDNNYITKENISESINSENVNISDKLKTELDLSKNINTDSSSDDLQQSDDSSMDSNNFDDLIFNIDSYDSILEQIEDISSDSNTSTNKDIFNQVRDGLNNLSGSKYIKFQLKPQGFGNVGISMKVINGKLELIFTVDNSLVEDILLSNINQLETMLSSSGLLSINEITIKKRDDNKSKLLKNKYLKNIDSSNDDLLNLKSNDFLNKFYNL